MSHPDHYQHLRTHYKPVSFRATYEMYDPEDHVVYLCYNRASNPYESIQLGPTETVTDYLRSTSGTWVYEDPDPGDIGQQPEPLLEPGTGL